VFEEFPLVHAIKQLETPGRDAHDAGIRAAKQFGQMRPMLSELFKNPRAFDVGHDYQAVAKSCFRLFSSADDGDGHDPAASSSDHHDDGQIGH
jgi:hypothetical protein